ncbi:co-chaperone GroES [Citroniella saccharovorans]|uniref:Co-chaperonin GroES n=1 Tax=Citroniella saccharovorans TaxID=2053367 RepID=A0AAW9MZA4_9FIRM|nr:co-chaperone GroES [Citroniella saccharovorans]MEB3429809.1 co-chaperone GroES [Citroniella saccharovorans]
MKLKPLDDRIVIKKCDVEEKTKSGLLLPSSAKEAPQFAEVVEIGDKILKSEKKSANIKVGDLVIYSKYAGTDVKIDSEEFTIVKYSDVLAVVEK